MDHGKFRDLPVFYIDTDTLFLPVITEKIGTDRMKMTSTCSRVYRVFVKNTV